MTMNTANRAALLCVSLALATGSTSVYAENTERTKTGDKSALSIDANLELGFSSEYNFDLIDDVETVHALEPKLELGVEYDNDDDLQIVVALEYGREWEGGNQGREDEYTTSLSLEEAFVEWSDLSKKGALLEDVTLTLGRRKLSDSREWFYDTSMDGLVLEGGLPTSDTDLMVSVNREEWIGSDLLRHDKPDTVSNLVLSLVHHPFKKMDVGAYAILRDDSSSDNDSPRFLGLSARGEVFDKRLKFWTDLATVRGQDDDERIDGMGFDVGATLNIFGAKGLYVTLGYAFGSGNGDKDTDFRQTGLHGNNDRFGGVTSFKYYGELMDPELSNLKILTAGIGFRTHRRMSVDLIYHLYEQDVALDDLRDTSLDIDPNGEDTDLGAELDLVAGFTIMDNLQSEWVLAYFQPGAAFDNTGEALFVAAKLSYEF